MFRGRNKAETRHELARTMPKEQGDENGSDCGSGSKISSRRLLCEGII